MDGITGYRWVSVTDAATPPAVIQLFPTPNFYIFGPSCIFRLSNLPIFILGRLKQAPG